MGGEIIWIGSTIYLRNVALYDTQTIMKWENNPENWAFSTTTEPFSEEEITHFIVEQMLQHPPTQRTEWRLMICLKNTIAIGTIDLTSIDYNNKTAEVGILIAEKKYRQKGYALETLQGIKHIAKNTLFLKTLKCAIQRDNNASRQLFTKANFQKIRTNDNQNQNLEHYQVSVDN